MRPRQQARKQVHTVRASDELPINEDLRHGPHACDVVQSGLHHMQDFTCVCWFERRPETVSARAGWGWYGRAGLQAQ